MNDSSRRVELRLLYKREADRIKRFTVLSAERRWIDARFTMALVSVCLKIIKYTPVRSNFYIQVSTRQLF